MKYSNEVIINAPRDKVVALFDNPEMLSAWQPGLQSYELMSGTAGQPGAETLLHYHMGKSKLEMHETIVSRNLPDEYSALYIVNGVRNEVSHFFEILPDNKTRYHTENIFFFQGYMKLFGWLFPKMFKQQSQIYMDDFKKFAEKEI